MDTSRHFPSLNGWRAGAILLVLASHGGAINGCPRIVVQFLGQVFAGELGVRFFFVISGFLITTLMLNEESQSGRVSISRFYTRRAARILPVYAACLAVMAILHWSGALRQPLHIWLRLLTFTRNFSQAGEAECWPSAQVWSLSVEEQFYLLWPLGFVLLSRSPRSRVSLLALVASVSLAWKTVALLGFYNRHAFFLFQKYSTFMQMDGLAYGCIAAILLYTRKDDLEDFFKKHSFWIPVASCAFIVIPEVCDLGITLQGIGFSFLMLQSVFFPRLGLFKILNHPWVTQIGVLSYSMYIWQQMIFACWPAPAWWFLAIPTTLIVAGLSYYLLEKPFLAIRERLRSGGASNSGNNSSAAHGLGIYG